MPRPTIYTTSLVRHIIVLIAVAIVLIVHLRLPPSSKSAFSLLKPKIFFQPTSNVSFFHPVPRSTYAIYSKDNRNLDHVKAVLRRIGFDQVQVDSRWDLLWAHDYPFLAIADLLEDLQPHQKVNHFPGIEHVTNRADLATMPLPFLPKTFKMPMQRDEFLKYALNHPTKNFIEKHNQGKFSAIKSLEKINLHSDQSFIQEFIENPFLVDGHKFEIEVYVVLTSVEPLRAYIYTGDVLIRYCSEKYYPFDPKNVDKYAISLYYLPSWEKGIKIYNRFRGTMKNTFDTYVRSQGNDPRIIWMQIEHIIRVTLQFKETLIVEALKSYKGRNFFDLMRFDFIVDEDLKVYLIKANMSPNLSSGNFKPNSLLYEQLLYSTLSLIGLRSPVEGSELALGGPGDMLPTDRYVTTLLGLCVDFDCDKSCNRAECELCLCCLSVSDYRILQEAYREHMRRINMKRVVPKPIDDLMNYDVEQETQSMSRKNRMLTRWFYGKCSEDVTWCN